MYWYTRFYLLGIFVSSSSNPTSHTASAIREYFQIPFNCCRDCFTVIQLEARWWNPPRVSPMRGVTTYVSEPKIGIACTTYM